MPRYADNTPPDDSALRPDPSAVVVSGRAVVIAWTNERQKDLAHLTEYANKFGLHVHLAPVDEGEKRRTSWTWRRVDLDFAMGAIRDAGAEGILFDDWANLWLDPAQQKTVAVRTAMRRKAQVALHRLSKEGRVVKTKSPENGRLILRAPEFEGS